MGRAVPDSEHSSIQESLRSFATETTPRPPGWLRAVLGHLKTEAGRYLAVLERPLTTSNVVPAGMVVSVQLTAATASRPQSYNVVVQNTATKPIEALRFGYLLDGEQHPRLFNRITFGPAPTPGQGPLQPGEAREFPGSFTRNADGSLPRVEPVFVLFQDSTFIAARTSPAQRSSRSDTARAALSSPSGTDLHSEHGDAQNPLILTSTHGIDVA